MSQKKILIVEDEVITAKILEDLLISLGYNVVARVKTGENAVKTAGKHRPDFVLMDIVLEGTMDGIDAAAEIKKRFGIPVIYLTAFSDDATISRAKETDPYGYLVKPFVKETIHSTIQIAAAKKLFDDRIRTASVWLNRTIQILDRGIITIDRNGRTILINAYAEQLTGWNIHDAYMKQLDDILQFYDSITDQPFILHITPTLNKGVVSVFPSDVYIISRKGGRQLLKDCVLSPVIDTKGIIIGALIAFSAVDDSRAKGEITSTYLKIAQKEPTHEAINQKEPAAPGNLKSLSSERITRILEEISDLMHLEQANTLSVMGKFEEAILEYQKALKIRSSNIQAWHNMGVILEKLGRNEEALDAFNKALEINTRSPETLRHKGEVLKKLGKVAESQQAFQQLELYTG
ncbi:response regulator [Methanoregula sp.]|uniref:response regulator n=1 Tax=Methanoregula sp. TaxID=2052170 RepID=UPI002B544615|nr:response regulator [Methanoregula sp.]HVP96089.1 response regulator [Methanoregula sp.]